MERLNKIDIIKKIVDKLDGTRIVVGGNKYFYKSKYHLQYTQEIVENVLNGFLGVMEEEMEQGNTIGFSGYMTIKPIYRNARRGRNVVAGKEVYVPAKYIPKITAGKRLKEACKRFDEKMNLEKENNTNDSENL